MLFWNIQVVVRLNIYGIFLNKKSNPIGLLFYYYMKLINSLYLMYEL